MLPFIIWLAVYTLALYFLGLVVRSWRNRTWFKALFLPGIALSAGLQKLAGILCIGSAKCSTSLLGDRSPPFKITKSRVPFFAWALFVLLSHLFIYSVFIVAVNELDRREWIDAHLVSLPSIHAYDMMEGYFKVDARDYVEDLAELRDHARENLWIALAVLWVAAGSFSALTLSSTQCRWTLTFLFLIGAASYISDWFGTGFPFLTRGWWAGFSFFPRCWSEFSLYITLLLVTLMSFSVCRTVTFAVIRLIHSREEDEE